MKHFTALMLAMAGIFTTQAQSYFQAGGILYKEVTKDPTKMQVRVCIMNEDGEPCDHYSDFYSGDIVIPATVEHDLDTYEVTQLQKIVFNGCSGLTSLTLGENITVIPDYTILSCERLATLKLTAVKEIGSGSLMNFSSLQTLDLGTALETIGEGSISVIPTLTAIRLPAGVKKLSQTMYNMPALEEVNLGNIETIKLSLNGTRLKTIDLTSAREITTSFTEMPCLQAITFGPNLKAIQRSFSGTSDAPLTIRDINLTGTAIDTISDSFNSNISVKSVALPKSTRLIESSFNSDGLESVTLNGTGLQIKNSFKDYSGTRLIIPEGVTVIENSFRTLPELTELILPESVTSVKDSFNHVNNLRTVVFGSKLTEYPELGNPDDLQEVWFGNPEPAGECPRWLMYRRGMTIHVPPGSADAYKTTWEIMSKQYSDTDLRIIEDTYKY